MSACAHHSDKFLGRVWLVHGFNVSDQGKGTVQTLRPYFEAAGFEVKLWRYGWRFLLMVRWLNSTFAQMLADAIEDGDVIVGHSNGCCIANLAANLGAPASQLVFINPALDSNVHFAPQIKRVHVWHSPSDTPVRWARFLPWHPWGDMGAVGYAGAYDARVTSYNKENGFPVSSCEHSDVFHPGKIEFFGPRIVQAVVDNHNPTAA